MADPVSATLVQAGLKAAGNFIKNDLIDRLFGSLFGGGGSDLPPLTPEQEAALEVSNALNMAQGDLYGDGQNEGFLEIVGPTFEEAVRKVQALDDSDEKTELLDVLANNTPYDFTDLTPASITGVEELDILQPSVDLSGIDTSGLENMGPKTLDQLTPPEIYETYKDRKIDDLITDFPTDEGGKYPFEFVRAILINSANEGDKNAAQILSNSGVPIDGGPGAFGGADGGMGPSQGTGPTGPSGPSGGNGGNVGNGGNQGNKGNQGGQIDDAWCKSQNPDWEYDASTNSCVVSKINDKKVDDKKDDEKVIVNDGNGNNDIGDEDTSRCGPGFRYDTNLDQCVPIINIGGLTPPTTIDNPEIKLPRPMLNVAPRNVVKIPDSTPISSTLFKTEIGRIDSPARTLFDNVLPRNSMLTRGRYDLS